MSTTEAKDERRQSPSEAQTASANGRDPGNKSSKAESSDAANVEEMAEKEYVEFLGKLPPEMGTLLILMGLAGIALPGPIGTPLLIAGAVVVWPKTFAPLERKFAKCFPEFHRKGVHQIKRFIHDLDRRFPEPNRRP